MAAYLDRQSIEFLDKEVFTDLTPGDRHEVDLIVKARFSDRPACFVIHVEAQSSAEPDFARRMFRYFGRLYDQFDLPIYPIVLFSYDSPLRPEPEEHRVEFPDLTVLTFRFRALQLNHMNWRDFVRRPNPVAAALMTKMRMAVEDRPRVKLECLRLLVTLKLDKARQTLIRGFMDSYLRLSAAEMAAYNREVATIDPPEQKVFMEMINEWEEIGEQRGLTKGLSQGLAQGVHSTVLRLLRRRFGEAATKLEPRIRDMDLATLESLADAILDFPDAAAAQKWIESAPVRAPSA